MTRVARFLVSQLIDLDVRGLENIPRDGKVIVYFNHTNFLDAVLAAVLVPRDVVVLSKVENFRNLLLGPLVRAYGAIPVRRGEADMGAFRRALAVLQAGKALLIAPEGTRSGHGRLQRAKDGLTLMALRTGAILVPMGLVGQRSFWHRITQLRKTRVCVWVGRSFHFLLPDGKRPSRQQVRLMTHEVMAEMAALLPPANRGAYSDDVDCPRQWISYETCGTAGG